MIRTALVARVVVACGAVLILAGCADTEPAPIPPAMPEPSSSPSSPTTPATPAITAPEDVTAAFREIAHASCDKAAAEGVVESSWDGTQKAILVPKSMAYQDYSAVFVDENGVPALIFSAENFASCGASSGFLQAEEAGDTYDIDLSFNLEDGTFESVLDQGEGQSVTFRYTVADGVFVSQDIDADWGQTTVEITYGIPSEDDIEFLRSAVDAFLAENG
jgi:hypothetical protein